MFCTNEKPSIQPLRIKKKKFLILKRLGVVKKRVKIVKNRFHNSIREKEFKIISVSLWWAITFKPFKIQTWDWSRMKENSKIIKKLLNVSFYFMKLLKTNFQTFFSQSNFKAPGLRIQKGNCSKLYFISDGESLIIFNSFSLMELWKQFLTIFTLFFTTPKRLKIKIFFFLILKA